MNYRKILFFTVSASACVALNAQSGPQLSKATTDKTKAASVALPSYRPTREEVLSRYRKAAILDSVSRNKVFKTTVQPNWQADGQTFWYRNSLKDTALEYYFVDAAKATKQKAFDHAKLAQAVAKAAGKNYDASRLRISNMSFENNGRQATFLLDGRWWKADLNTYEITTASTPTGFRDRNDDDDERRAVRGRGNFANTNEVGPLRRRARAFRSDSLSPDRMWVAYLREGNVFVKPANGGDSTQFTTDGNRENPYGNLSWSPDSKNLIGYHVDPVTDKQVHYILTSASGTRGELKSRGYAQPGDENTSYEMFIFNIGDKKKTKVDIDKIDFSGPPYLNWRAGDNKPFATNGSGNFKLVAR